jgi:4-hydroxy-3-polyprenylbenzoate decarboxylase
VAFPIDDPAGAMSSGYFQTIGMVMAPCSMRSLGKITHGIISNMLTRAADVQ